MMPFPDSWKLGALAASLVVAGAVGCQWGRHVANGECAVKELAATVKAQQQFDEKAQIINELSEKLERMKNERTNTTETITKEVDRIVDRPIYLNKCLDDDGLRSANAALLGKPLDSSKSDPAMPSTKAPK